MRLSEVSPLFIVGASRSGTTVLCRALSASPAILALNELHFFGDLCSPDDRSQWSVDRAKNVAAQLLMRCDHPIWQATPDQEVLAMADSIVESMGDEIRPCDLYRAVLRSRAQSGSVQYAIDQTPRNIFYLSVLLEQFPDAMAINIVRDPRAVALSQRLRYRKRWGSTPDMPWSQVLRVWGNYHPYTVAKLWKRATDCARGLAGHPRILSVSYEELVTKPDAVLMRMCQELGVEFDRAMLMVEQAGSSRESGTSAGSGFATDGVDAWRHQLPRCDAALIESRLMQSMSQWGYDAGAGPATVGCRIKAALKWPIHALLVMALNPRRALTQLRALLMSRT